MIELHIVGDTNPGTRLTVTDSIHAGDLLAVWVDHPGARRGQSLDIDEVKLLIKELQRRVDQVEIPKLKAEWGKAFAGPVFNQAIVGASPL